MASLHLMLDALRQHPDHTKTYDDFVDHIYALVFKQCYGGDKSSPRRCIKNATLQFKTNLIKFFAEQSRKNEDYDQTIMAISTAFDGLYLNMCGKFQFVIVSTQLSVYSCVVRTITVDELDIQFIIHYVEPFEPFENINRAMAVVDTSDRPVTNLHLPRSMVRVQYNDNETISNASLISLLKKYAAQYFENTL